MINNGNGVYTRVQQGRLQVIVPYNPKFVLFAHSQAGRWRKRTGMWSFKRVTFAMVAGKLNELYGTSIKVRVTEAKDV